MIRKTASGKTRSLTLMTRAEAVRQTQGLAVVRIDLGAIVSRYAGEAEKALDTVLAEARAAGAVLLFDEADALFGKRTGVRDAHDRYAAIDAAGLLARLERYDGTVIVTSEDQARLDDDIARRLRLTVETPKPVLPVRKTLRMKTP